MMRLFAFMLISLFVGCVHVPLRKNTLKQAQSLSDLHEQQVLSNIAKSIAEPNSVPYFAIPKAGSTQVTGTGGSTLSLVWNPRTIVSETLGLNASGTLSENWTLEPINNPDKLNLMSCLLKHVSCKTYGECEDCEKRLTTFFKEKYPTCLPQCWFHHGCKSDVPKHCRKVGRHDSTYVWVTPQYYGELNIITLAFLDIATADLTAFQPSKPFKVTQTFKGANGNEIKGEYNVSKDDYDKMIKTMTGVEKTMNATSTSDSNPEATLPIIPFDILTPSTPLEDSSREFKKRTEPFGGLDSLLLLPRQ